MCNKLRAILATFFILKYKILLTLYKTLAESIMLYAISSYGRTYKSYLDKIYNLQIRLLKAIVPKSLQEKHSKNYEIFLEECNILSVYERVELALLVENYFNSTNYKSHYITTRQVAQKKLEIIDAKNVYGKRKVDYIVPRLINNIPIIYL